MKKTYFNFKLQCMPSTQIQVKYMYHIVWLFIILLFCQSHLSRVARKPDFCIGENKGADQLCGFHTLDQRLCFVFAAYTDTFIYLHPNFQASSHLLWLYSKAGVRPRLKPRRQVFSRRGSLAIKRGLSSVVILFHRKMK